MMMKAMWILGHALILAGYTAMGLWMFVSCCQVG